MQEMNKIINNEKSPTVLINNSLFIYLIEKNIMFLSIVAEDTLITSVYKVLETIKNVINTSLNGLNAESIRDNFVHILLMIDQYIMDGVPSFQEENVLASLISPIDFTDKITENIIGKNKDYKCTTLNNFLREIQSGYDTFKYKNDNIVGNYQLLFNFKDNLDLVYDKYLNINITFILY